MFDKLNMPEFLQKNIKAEDLTKVKDTLKKFAPNAELTKENLPEVIEKIKHTVDPAKLEEFKEKITNAVKK